MMRLLRRHPGPAEAAVEPDLEAKHTSETDAAASSSGQPRPPDAQARVSTSGTYKKLKKSAERNQWALAFGTGGFTTLCMLISFHILQSVMLSQRAAFQIDESNTKELFYQKTLAFDVCNGMANQRLSMLYGVMLAYELGRTVVLPEFLLSGVQWSDQDTLGGNNNTVPMDRIYDVPYFVYSISSVGVDVLPPEDMPPRDLFTHVKLDGMSDPVDVLQVKYTTTQHLYVGCPLFKLHAYYFTASNNRVMWAVLNGMRPNQNLLNIVSGVTRKLQYNSPTQAYNFVHLRMETDWVLHCSRWENIPDGRIRNNCMNNTDDMHRVLYSLNVPTDEPLYVAAFWEQCDVPRSERILSLLEAAGYKVYTSNDFVLDLSGEDREVNAMIDYEIAMRARKYVGNSVSTFSALAIHQRRHNGLWSSYYNGGNIPVSDFLPMDMMPWVFVYSDDRPAWDPMVKAAVRSAVHYHTMRVFCIWLGNSTVSPMYSWLVSEEVTMIHYQPEWEEQLWAMAQPHMEANSKLSRVYTNRASLLADFIRLDLPLIPELEQYIYVLFTEPDIFFAKKTGLGQFPLPLPEFVGFPSDPSVQGGMDSGIMLVDLPAVREDYDDFRLFVFANRHGGYWPGYPTGLGGAYVQFYETSARFMKLLPELAAKPWQEFSPGARILHFQGPKPHEYLSYFNTLKCPVNTTHPGTGSKCLKGFRHGLCPYTKKWYKMLNETEDDQGLVLWYACTTLYAPHLDGISKHPLRVGNVTE